MVRFACQLFFGLNGALAPCRMERSGIRLNLFLFSAVRVFNTFNIFNRFSTKCCTMDFVIFDELSTFQQVFNSFFNSFFATFFSYLRKKSRFSTFPLSLLLRLQQVNIISLCKLRVCTCAHLCVRVRARTFERSEPRCDSEGVIGVQGAAAERCPLLITLFHSLNSVIHGVFRL